MNIYEHNQQAWDLEVANRGEWSRPVPLAAIDAARRGEWEIRLTPNTPVPRAWFPPLANKDVLCLAGGGGQQSPILAATGARVVVLDSSEGQLGVDRMVAEASGLSLRTVQGDMANMHALGDASFDVIVNPCSNCFVPDLRLVWREVHRVLKPGGVLMVGFLNPIYFMFDRTRDDQGVLEVRHALPFSDVQSITEVERQKKLTEKAALEFGHTLTQQIGGQLEADLILTHFLEDRWSDRATTLNRYTPVFCVTRSVRRCD
jgi:SAM-dependent methyltransferase